MSDSADYCPTPTHVAWQAAGGAPVDKCEPADGRCYLCGGAVERGQPVRKWVGSGFVEQYRVACPTAEHVCEACCYVTSRTSPVMGRPPKPGKKYGGNFRNYSHGYDAAGGYWNASKGEKGRIREFLRGPFEPPWFLGVADSGQKHVLPFAQMNVSRAAGLVEFETERVYWPGPRGVELVDTLADLMTWGAPEAEILTGDYSPYTWRRVGLDRLREFERGLRHGRDGALFRLCVWLAQRDEDEWKRRQKARKEGRDDGRRRGARGALAQGCGALPDGGAQRRAPGRSQPDQGVGAAGEPSPELGGAGGDGAGVVLRDSADDAGGGAVQMDLFGH